MQSSGIRLDAGAVQGSVFSGVLGFLMLHTCTGRRFALAGAVGTTRAEQVDWSEQPLFGRGDLLSHPSEPYCIEHRVPVGSGEQMPHEAEANVNSDGGRCQLRASATVRRAWVQNWCQPAKNKGRRVSPAHI